jgi:hypothetical protein
MRFVKVECKGLRLTIREVIFIEDGFRDNVFFGSPGAEIEEAAPLAAKGKIRIPLGVGRFLADGANMFHGEERVLPQRAPRSHRGKGESRV